MRVTSVSAAPLVPPPPSPPVSTHLTGWGPSSGRGRKEEQDPRPPDSTRGGGGALVFRPLPSLYGPWPAPAPAQPVPERACRRHSTLSYQSPAQPTSEPEAGPWGCPRGGSRSYGAPRTNASFPASGPWSAAELPCVRCSPRYARLGKERAAGPGGHRVQSPGQGCSRDARRPLGVGPGAKRGGGPLSVLLGLLGQGPLALHPGL